MHDMLDPLFAHADPASHDQTLKAARDNADQVAKLALARLSKEGQKAPTEGKLMEIHTAILNQLSREPKHPLRNALLVAGSIITVTKNLVSISGQIHNVSTNPTLIEAMISCFEHLGDCIESTDGFTWVSQSVKAGLLLAYVKSSPVYSNLDPEDCNMVFSILKDVVPRYMVYRSVVQTVGTALDLVQKSNADTGKVEKSIAKNV